MNYFSSGLTFRMSGGYQKVAADEELCDIVDAENNKTTSEKLTVRY